MIKILNTKSKNFNSQLSYYLDLRKNYSNSKNLTVKKIVNDVRKNNDKSLIKYEKKFNKLKTLTKNNLRFSEKEIKNLKEDQEKVKKEIDSQKVNYENLVDRATLEIESFIKKHEVRTKVQ